MDEDVEGSDDAVTKLFKQHFNGLDPGPAFLQKLKEAAMEEALKMVGPTLRRAEKETQQATDKAQQAVEEAQQAKENLQKTGMITGRAFCDAIQWHEDTSASPAHLHDVEGAIFTTINTKDHRFVLADEFWDQPVYKAHEERILKAANEATVEDMILADLDSTRRAMILSGELPKDCSLSFRRQQAIMGLWADIGVIHGPNEFLCGTVEVKKHDVKHLGQIMKPGGAGAGQVFDQLSSCQIGMRGDSYALLSTRNQTRLVSTGDFAADMKELHERRLRNGSSTHESPERSMLAKRQACPKRSERFMWSCPLVSVGSSSQNAQTRRAANRAYLKTLAKFILLAHQAACRGPRDVTQSPLEGPVRTFNVDFGTCVYGTLNLKQGINFCRTPNKRHKNFTAWSQLGIGQSACCCLATAGSKQPANATQGTTDTHAQNGSATQQEGDEEAVACVLKIYHRTTEEQVQLAQTEAQRWRLYYKEKKWTFIQVYTGRTKAYLILVLPYLHVPTAEERKQLLEAVGGKQEDSALWKGLKGFADKGVIHEDLKWHHVGLLPGTSYERASNGSLNKVLSVSELNEIYLLDLEHARPVPSPAEREMWVKQSYEYLSARA
jgi:Family of unknown function (DUF5898)